MSDGAGGTRVTIRGMNTTPNGTTGGQPTKMSVTVLRARARRIPADQIVRIERELTAAGRERDARIVRDEIARRGGAR